MPRKYLSIQQRLDWNAEKTAEAKAMQDMTGGYEKLYPTAVKAHSMLERECYFRVGRGNNQPLYKYLHQLSRIIIAGLKIGYK